MNAALVRMILLGARRSESSSSRGTPQEADRPSMICYICRHRHTPMKRGTGYSWWNTKGGRLPRWPSSVLANRHLTGTLSTARS